MFKIISSHLYPPPPPSRVFSHDFVITFCYCKFAPNLNFFTTCIHAQNIMAKYYFPHRKVLPKHVKKVINDTYFRYS